MRHNDDGGNNHGDDTDPVMQRAGRRSSAALRPSASRLPRALMAAAMVAASVAEGGVGPAAAQTLPAQAASAVAATPGALPTHDQLDPRASTDAKAQRRSALHVHLDDTIEHAPCALDAPAYAAIRIKLSEADFAHLAPVSARTLDAAWRPFVGSDQPISVLCRVRDSAATILRAMGYLAAVEVPVQRIVDGKVRFEVLFARVVGVRVIGHPGNDARLLESTLRGLVTGQPFNIRDAERKVLLAREIPGYDVHLTLKPATQGPATQEKTGAGTSGAMIAEIFVEATPVVADATVSNLAAPATGRYGAQLRASFNGLLGDADQTSLSLYSTVPFDGQPVRRQQIWQAAERLALGSDGWGVEADLTRAITRPALPAGYPEVIARTWVVDLALHYPWLRHGGREGNASGGIDLLDQDVTFGGLPLSRDRLRVAWLRVDLSAQDQRGRGPGGAVRWKSSVSGELRHGLSVLGATPDCAWASQPCRGNGFVAPSVTIGDPRALVGRANADLEWRPADAATFAVSVHGQYASAPLYAYEQFSLGNYTVGRGYGPGSLLGDDGASVAIEARGKVFQLRGNGALQLQPYVYSDNGWVWRRLAEAPLPTRAELHSLGGGARLVFAGTLQLDLSVAVPLTRLPTEAKLAPPLVLLSLSSGLVPWRFR